MENRQSKKNSKFKISINTKLLNLLKEKVKSQGTNLNSYIREILVSYISNEKVFEKSQSNNTAIKNEILSLEDLKGTTISGFDKVKVIEVCQIISDIFKEECNKKSLTTTQGAKEIKPIMEKYFLKNDREALIKMFVEDTIVTNGPEIGIDIFVRYGNKCPMINVFKEWTGADTEQLEKSLCQCVII